MPHLRASEANIFYEQLGQGPDIVWVGGGGTAGRDWQRFQTPFFEPAFRNTTFDNRGIGETTSDRPMPWPMADFARDLAELIEAVCEPPVAVVGSSFGSAIIQELAIERPDLLRCAVVMGSGAHSTGWGWDFQEAEIEFRRAGGRLDGMMGVAHYAPMLYPARVLGDRELWPKLRALMLEWMDSGENEESLIPQWDASLRFDQRDRLPGVRVPFHVISFAEDIQAPPQDADELAALIPGAELHRLEGMGHGSWYGHAHDEINPFIRELIERHLDAA
jgi:pimeloyl-ACP methyl ester carboxylesterase